MQVTVDGTPLSIEGSTTAAELFARLQPDVDPDATGYWILAREDGRKYIENPQRKDLPLTFLIEEGEDELAIYLEQPPKCSHGSPAVRNKGFLCGWC